MISIVAEVALPLLEGRQRGPFSGVQFSGAGGVFIVWIWCLCRVLLSGVLVFA